MRRRGLGRSAERTGISGSATPKPSSAIQCFALSAQQTGFSSLAAHTDFVANLSYREQPSYSRGGALVSGAYFAVLGLRAALGRLIVLEDEPQVGESAVVVLSYDYRQRRFGGDPNVLGELLTVNGRQLEIIGVAPEGFTGTILGVRMDVFVRCRCAG